MQEQGKTLAQSEMSSLQTILSMTKRDSDDPKPLCPLHTAVTEAREETQAAALSARAPHAVPPTSPAPSPRQQTTETCRGVLSCLAFAKNVLFAVTLE